MKRISRREFVVASGAAVAALPLTGDLARLHESERAERELQGSTVLFQGDSITDGGRTRNDTKPNSGSALGTGYPLLVAAALLRRQPDAGWRFFNRGVSGDRVPELEARWTTDTIALEPSILTVLVGVNDFWHTKMGRYAGTTADYEAGYAALLERTRRDLPSVRILVLEPFVLPVGFVDESWFPAFHERRAAAKRVAERVRATFIPLQARFDEAAKAGTAGNGKRERDAAYWAADGVHPTPAGHQLIADAVLEAFGASG